jgi:hypothetical protein
MGGDRRSEQLPLLPRCRRLDLLIAACGYLQLSNGALVLRAPEKDRLTLIVLNAAITKTVYHALRLVVHPKIKGVDK